MKGSKPTERVKDRISRRDLSPGTSQEGGRRLLFLDQFLRVLGPGEALHELLTPTGWRAGDALEEEITRLCWSGAMVAGHCGQCARMTPSH